METPDGNQVEVREIHSVPFDSKRKRMSLIFEEISPSGEKSFKIFTKGADTTMLERLSESALNDFKTNAVHQINEYSKEGLRSLVFASRKVLHSFLLFETLLKSEQKFEERKIRWR